MTQSGIESATTRLIAQCLNQLRQRVPLELYVVHSKRNKQCRQCYSYALPQFAQALSDPLCYSFNVLAAAPTLCTSSPKQLLQYYTNQSQGRTEFLQFMEYVNDHFHCQVEKMTLLKSKYSRTPLIRMLVNRIANYPDRLAPSGKCIKILQN